MENNEKFLWYKGKTMKNILEDKGLWDCWSYCNTDTNEIIEAPDTNWLRNIIFELQEIKKFDNDLIMELLEEYFIERKKGIIDEWRDLAIKYLNI